MSINVNGLFSAIPQTLRDELFESFQNIVRNFSENRWEPAELNGGKFSEVVYTIIEGALNGNYAVKAKKPPNFVEACRAIEKINTITTIKGERSLRILIPRLLPYLYEIRNNRGVGHVGGEVNPNHMDATSVLSSAKWVMAELVRIFHAVTIKEAQDSVDAMTERHLPFVWGIDQTKRVLDNGMKKSDQLLVLLYSEMGWVPTLKLFAWVEYSSASSLRNKILLPLHKQRHIEFDKSKDAAHISPKGIEQVENRLFKN